MAEGVVLYREQDVRGAKLREKCVEKNTEDDLRRWIDCRGLSTTKTETHASLVRSHSFAQRLQDEERGQLVHKPRQIRCNSHWSSTKVDNHLRSLDKTQCQLCGKIFRRVSDVRIHERVHSGERPYHCHFCGNKFKQQGHLQTHIRIHTGEKPFICPKCGRRFKDPSVKNKHVKRCKVYTGK